MKKWFYALMLVFAAVLGGCRGEHSLGKDIYVYVFTQDFDAERIGGEFEMTGFSKGTYVPQNEMFEGDSVVVTRQFGKEFVPYRVPLSVLRLLTPEEYRAAKEGDKDSPHYLGSRLERLLYTHNVLLLSDGSTPEKTAKTADSALWYILIPVVLLLIVAYLCGTSDGSIVLPAIGLALMIAQLVMLALIVGKNGLYIKDFGDFIIVGFIPFALVMVSNTFAGLKMQECLLEYYGVEAGSKLVLQSVGIGILVAILLNVGSGWLLGETAESWLVQTLKIASYALGFFGGCGWFFYKLRQQNPDILKAAPLSIAIIFFTLLFGGLLALIAFVILIVKLAGPLITSAGKPGGKLLGGPDPETCRHCRHYNGGTCSRQGGAAVHPDGRCSDFEY